jgi:hypothetical protein
MLTKEQEILNYHAIRMELRARLVEVVEEFAEKVSKEDALAEVDRLHMQIGVFHGCVAYEKARSAADREMADLAKKKGGKK